MSARRGRHARHADRRNEGTSPGFHYLNRNVPGESIGMQLVEGPFREFSATWRFQPLGAGGRPDRVHARYEFASRSGAAARAALRSHRRHDGRRFPRRAEGAAEVEVVYALPSGSASVRLELPGATARDALAASGLPVDARHGRHLRQGAARCAAGDGDRVEIYRRCADPRKPAAARAKRRGSARTTADAARLAIPAHLVVLDEHPLALLVGARMRAAFGGAAPARSCSCPASRAHPRRPWPACRRPWPPAAGGCGTRPPARSAVRGPFFASLPSGVGAGAAARPDAGAPSGVAFTPGRRRVAVADLAVLVDPLELLRGGGAGRTRTRRGQAGAFS